MFTVRPPKAAGLFYNSERAGLEGDIRSFYSSRGGPGDPEPEPAKALIVPHNKYHLCGGVSAWGFSRLERSNYVVIGPNHHGIGARFAVMREGLWKTPLGEVAASRKMAQKVMDRSALLEHDVTPHNAEHSIEVQLPFLQQRFGNDFEIVPILVANKFEDEEFLESCVSLGRSIAQSMMTERGRWTVLATTDLSRGRKDDVERVDRSISAAMKKLSEKGLHRAVHRNASYICGYGAAVAAMSAAKQLGAKRGKVLKYASSREDPGDPKSFVGYASVIFR